MSLRELFIIVTCCGMALASLGDASELWLNAVVALVVVAAFAAFIAAAVDRSRRQAFAIGFAIPVIAYYFIIAMAPRATQGDVNREFDLWQGRLPTTRLLRQAHSAFDKSRWIDYQTKQEVSIDMSRINKVDIRTGLVAGTPGGGNAVYLEQPPREFFMPIGHCWWAVLLGYVGGRFARFVYVRRTKDENG